MKNIVLVSILEKCLEKVHTVLVFFLYEFFICSGIFPTFYFRKQYNIVIKNRTQPLLLNKRKPPKGAPVSVITSVFFIW